jgi:pyrimidine deaminase RibD-like protein
LYSKTIAMDNSKYFRQSTEIDKAIADHQRSSKGAYQWITLEECSKYQQAVFKPVMNITN